MKTQLRRPEALRIGLLMHSLNPRGGVVHTLELADALCERGHDVTVFAPAAPGQALFRGTQAKLSVAPLHTAQPSTQVSAEQALVHTVSTRVQAMAQHLRNQSDLPTFDVLHSQDSITANALALLRDEGLITGFVRTVHHLDDFEDPTLRGWQNRGVHAASQLLCVSPLWQAVLSQDWGLHAQVVSNGVNLGRFQAPPQPQDAQLLADLGIDIHTGIQHPIWLAVGGVEARKNTVRLLQAFALTQTQPSTPQQDQQPSPTGPEGRLVIAGGASLLHHDAYAASFHTALHTLSPDIRARVIVTGPLPDATLAALYRHATALVMPSVREGFGLVALEALACGTPAIVSRIAPFTDHFAPHEVLWADPLSVTSIAQALLQSTQHKHRAPVLDAAPAVCARFAWSQSAAHHEAIYRALLSLSLLAANPAYPSATEPSHA